jgi:methylglutaconyl-CoA hydratase
MTKPPLLTEVDSAGTAWLTLNRPEIHNAFDDALIAHMAEALAKLTGDPTVRALVLAAEGKSFSAGADLNWMRRMAAYSFDENVEDAAVFSRMLNALDRFPRPTVALVKGAVFGGGVGLVAACDIAIAAEDTVFALTEVRLGLVPAVISPYVVAAIGARQARRYMLTAERFGAPDALRFGLVHQVVPADDLRAAGDLILGILAANGPAAVAEAKDLVFAVAGRPVDDAVLDDTARRIARLRASEEGRDGVAAFLDKRKPAWAKE